MTSDDIYVTGFVFGLLAAGACYLAGASTEDRDLKFPCFFGAALCVVVATLCLWNLR